VRFGTWRLLRVDHLVIGRVTDGADGWGHEIEYHLLDVHSGRILLSQALPVAPGDLRFGAHRVTDAVYEALIGMPGAFATRIAYVVVTDQGGSDELFELVVADADGFNPQTVVRNTQPILSPAWSPDGRRLAYVSFATGRSNIIVQDLYTGQNRGGQFRSWHQWRTGLVAGRPPAGGQPVAWRQPGYLGDQPMATDRPRTVDPPLVDQYRAGLVNRRAQDLLHLRPCRSSAGLCPWISMVKM
jgi:hypothetical protein